MKHNHMTRDIQPIWITEIDNKSPLHKSVDILIENLKSDDGYYTSWHANIAMAFKDQASWDKRDWQKDDLHETATKAAHHFLKILCMEKKER